MISKTLRYRAALSNVTLLLRIIIIIIENDFDEVLPDVVNIAFHRCQHDLPAWLYPLSP
jgi:hypothetical protein